MPWSAAGGCAARPGKRPAIRHLRGSAAAEPSRPALVSTRCPANDPPARSGRRRLGTGGLPCGGAGRTGTGMPLTRHHPQPMLEHQLDQENRDE
jgi:hypothetical protein